MEGAPDRELAAAAAACDYVFVTNNRRDLLRLCAEIEVHNGLIIVVPMVSTDEQIRLFQLALDVAERQNDLVNLLIEVHSDGTVEVQNWVRAGSGTEGRAASCRFQRRNAL